MIYIFYLLLELLHTAYTCLFYSSLWHPQACTVGMNHYRMGWVQEDVEPNAKVHAMDSLKGWVLGLRKGAKKGISKHLRPLVRSLCVRQQRNRWHRSV